MRALSGMVTEADHGNWTEKQLRPYFDTVLHAFGPDRLMVGSDWPVCTLAAGYADALAVVVEWSENLSADELSIRCAEPYAHWQIHYDGPA